MQEEKINELSYFRTLLFHYLNEYHPHLSKDDRLINIRVQAAEDRFCDLIHDGEDHYTAHALALQELYTGLEFSLYYLIYDILRENAAIPAKNGRQLSSQILSVCDGILDSYEGIDFYEDAFSYRVLILEITDIIQKYLKQNGIQ